MLEVALVALACSLGVVVYLLAGFLVGVMVAKFDSMFAHGREAFALAVYALFWPITVMCYGVWAFGKLLLKLGNG